MKRQINLKKKSTEKWTLLKRAVNKSPVTRLCIGNKVLFFSVDQLVLIALINE